MLSYELCKKLKDAGFSQEFNSCENLSELIKACFSKNEEEYVCPHNSYPRFDKLETRCGPINHEVPIRTKRCPLIWRAYANRGNVYCEAYTPEEAVANLYLELHNIL